MPYALPYQPSDAQIPSKDESQKDNSCMFYKTYERLLEKALHGGRCMESLCILKCMNKEDSELDRWRTRVVRQS
jgi:hypothetical protein